MDQDEWIQKLKRMGLSGYEARVYLSLLGETRAPASRVVRNSGVPQSKVYGALSSLVDRGFAEQVLGEVKMFRGIPPKQAFENYQRSIEHSLAASRDDMAQLSEKAPDGPTDDPGMLGIRLVRSGQIAGAVKDAMHGAQSELLVSTVAPVVLAPDPDMNRKLANRGVNFQCLYENSVLEDPNYASAVMRENEEYHCARFVEKLPMRFVIVDRNLAMVELSEKDGSVAGLVVPNERFAENMRLLFNQFWNIGKTPEDLSINSSSAS
ncbi:helix-turn-helix domain-containing protein [Planctomycetota bacterium]|nr:helix-turn-helix domain-containing protein [Planctomycetota bacterium]